MDIESLEKKKEEIKLEIQPLLDLSNKLRRQIATAKSVKFIRDNEIVRSQVQLCSGEDVPYFNDVYSFGAWMRKNSTKPWLCWNGCIYESSEIISGRMMREPLGRYEDITE